MANFNISSSQQQQLKDRGYVLLEQALPQALLLRWQSRAAELERRALEAQAQGRPLYHACVVQDPVGPRLMRYDDVFADAWDDSLALLACPAMLVVAQQLCGDGTVPLQLDILYKHQHPHPVINWHQGAQHPRSYPYLNIGIYLDPAPAGDGCLRYVPGTQHRLHDIQDLSAEHGWDIPGVAQQPAQPGDILVQDMMILHGSEPKRSPGCRRTIYVELRPMAGILESGRQSPEWAELRRQWMALVLERANPADVPPHWYELYPVGKVDEAELRARLVAQREAPIPAVWATFPVEHPNYPVPADLR
ncbi:phytanoyl-CoA dioxygenase family protein [Shewanella sedimentimangrovi]|uniref:Phytanoyl-CoA dioxygenase family protein n=1 Tax=Shewanella sedimentimangrovi TaxID=2814293 RepID=A0ABX7R0T9_9GAMM|nr:phytanoyl-CoA dioxygenase family protein [Shewanella sedimentimangrovi]QSX37411.1 phytanoyl-CoA dioxygenase family protein [Shewanella sedimentimangrovi]